MADRQAIVDAIEGSMFTLPDVPGINNVLTIPGVAAMHGIFPSPELNAVGKARLTDENVDATIERVKETFRELGKVMKPGAILASNTSTISITRMAESAPDPSRARTSSL